MPDHTLNYFIKNNKVFLLGEEVWCPEGLGRIAKIEEVSVDSIQVLVETYVNSKGSWYEARNISTLEAAKRAIAIKEGIKPA